MNDRAEKGRKRIFLFIELTSHELCSPNFVFRTVNDDTY